MLVDSDVSTDTFDGTAMASPVRIVVAGPGDRRAAQVAAMGVIGAFEAACSRFDPSSELSLLNAAPSEERVVSAVFLDALAVAREAHLLSEGRFDPRVVADLMRLGYDRTFADVTSRAEVAAASPRTGRWAPTIDGERMMACLGGAPIDLGGIVKGLAVDRAACCLRAAGLSGLVDLGGDGSAVGPDVAWSIGVEDPHGGEEPLAVIAVTEGSWATTSTRIRRWRAGDVDVHHVIDPSTGEPGGDGLAAVTVLAATATEADVHAKIAFLEGARSIDLYCRDHELAALWVDDAGVVSSTPAFDAAMVWKRS